MPAMNPDSPVATCLGTRGARSWSREDTQDVQLHSLFAHLAIRCGGGNAVRRPVLIATPVRGSKALSSRRKDCAARGKSFSTADLGMKLHPGVGFLLALVGLMLGIAPVGSSQSRRHIKVVLETQQSGTSNRETVQGSGSVIIRRGTVSPSGRVTAADRQTTVKRSSGIFTLVLDGSESILTVATRVPQSEIPYFHRHAIGIGYVERQITFIDVGTSLRVHATALPDGLISLRLTPRISYFSVDRPGTIDFTEAATELIVPNGQAVSLGGSTMKLNEITRQILGYQDRASSSETNLVVTATIQN